DLGERVELRQRERVRSGRQDVEDVATAGRQPAHVRRLRGRARRRVAERLRRQRGRPVRAEDGDVPGLPQRCAGRQRPPDARPGRRGLGARVGQRSTRGLPYEMRRTSMRACLALAMMLLPLLAAAAPVYAQDARAALNAAAKALGVVNLRSFEMTASGESWA